MTHHWQSLYRFVWVLPAFLSACANLPPELEAPDVAPVHLPQVVEEPTAFQGEKVRWGGVILSVENETKETWVQILEKPLNRSGRPKESAQPRGRFLMHTTTFLDPAIYSQGKELTVVGTLNSMAERTVGKRKIQLPVIEAESWRLWPEQTSVRTPAYPYWWYDPWWGLYYRGWPYWYY